MPKSATMHAPLFCLLAACALIFSIITGCSGSCSFIKSSVKLEPGLSEQCVESLSPNFGEGPADIPLPKIYAHYLAQSLPSDAFLENIFANDHGRLEFAPGPFVLEKDKSLEDLSLRWQLQAMPNYFVLNIKNRKKQEPSFYLTNQNGLPLSCQYFQLEKHDDTTLVLMPKVSLEPKQVYFLYLIFNDGINKQKWIQPIVAPKNSDSPLQA
jgi:hypothetical protein